MNNFYKYGNDDLLETDKIDDGKSGVAGVNCDTKKYLTITEITRRIKRTLEDGFSGIWLVGEVSNAKKPGSGHIYLTLKDANSQLQAVIFRSVANRIKFDLKDGIDVIVYGSIAVYEPRGQYQIIVESVEPKGVGALQLAFQQLKAKLEKEGFFDQARKRQLPFLPRKIAIVTSPTGAAIQDMVNIINRRCPGVQIVVYPVKVQGIGAAEEIAQAVDDINTLDDVDVMIVGRGGGSIEDLWAFNEEVVARSIYKSKIPVISAVGHETDVTISDFVADKRALTPSEAGEMVVPRLDMLTGTLNAVKQRFDRALKNQLLVAQNRLQTIANSFAFRKPLDRVNNLQQKLDDTLQKMNSCIKHVVEMEKKRLLYIAGKLDNLNPLSILRRGYSLTTKVGELNPVKSISDIVNGDRIETKFSDGSVVSVVEGIN